MLVDPDVVVAYGTDWTRRWTAPPAAVVRPADAAEVAAILQVCAAHGTAVVPQGGNTGLVGGSVPRVGRPPAVVLSTQRFTRLDPVDVTTRQVVVGAGVTLAALQQQASASGLRYAVDLAARDSATVGGMVATNAGGLRVLAFGDTRRQVVGVEAVLADGSVVDRLGGLAKDNGGYDLSQLLVGSEGTLGVLTAVRLRLLAAAPNPRRSSSSGCPTSAAALPWLSLRGLTAAELMLDRGLALVEQVAGLPHPLARPAPCLSPARGRGRPPRVLADLDTAVGPTLWAYRERHTEAVATRGRVHKLDVAVPVRPVPALVAALDEVLAGALTDRGARARRTSSAISATGTCTSTW